MPVKKVKKTRGQTIIQNVKVVLEGKQKRARKKSTRKPRVGMRTGGQAPLTGPNTITSEQIPLPPRIIEVPVPYRLAEGSTTATGIQPQAPAITAPPSKPAITYPEPSKPAITYPEPSKAIKDKPLTQEEEDFYLQIKPSSTFYKSYERQKPTPSKLQEYSFSAVNPLARKQISAQETMISSQPIIDEPRSISAKSIKKEQPAEGPMIIELGSTPSLVEEVTKPSQIVDFPPAKKEESSIIPSSEGAISAATETESLSTITSSQAFGQKTPLPKRPNWNARNEALIQSYSKKFKVSEYDALQKLMTLRSNYPHVTAKEVKSAIKSAQSESSILL